MGKANAQAISSKSQVGEWEYVRILFVCIYLQGDHLI